MADPCAGSSVDVAAEEVPMSTPRPIRLPSIARLAHSLGRLAAQCTLPHTGPCRVERRVMCPLTRGAARTKGEPLPPGAVVRLTRRRAAAPSPSSSTPPVSPSPPTDLHSPPSPLSFNLKHALDQPTRPPVRVGAPGAARRYQADGPDREGCVDDQRRLPSPTPPASRAGGVDVLTAFLSP